MRPYDYHRNLYPGCPARPLRRLVRHHGKHNSDMSMHVFRSLFNEWYQRTVEPEGVTYRENTVGPGVPGIWCHAGRGRRVAGHAVHRRRRFRRRLVLRPPQAGRPRGQDQRRRLRILSPRHRKGSPSYRLTPRLYKRTFTNRPTRLCSKMVFGSSPTGFSMVRNSSRARPILLQTIDG